MGHLGVTEAGTAFPDQINVYISDNCGFKRRLKEME